MAPEPEKKHTGPYSFLNSYVSLRDDFANDSLNKENDTVHELSLCFHCFYSQFSTETTFLKIAQVKV